MIIVVIGHRECHDKEVSQWISVCWKLQKWTSGAQNGTFSKSWISIYNQNYWISKIYNQSYWISINI